MKPTLIIADDMRAIREELIEALQEDFEILAEAVDGLNAVELALSLRPELVLMDVMMPKCSGIDATREILKRMPIPPRIIMLSGLREERIVLAALQAGASDYLFKPMDPKRVSQVLWASWREKAGESVA